MNDVIYSKTILSPNQAKVGSELRADFLKYKPLPGCYYSKNNFLRKTSASESAPFPFMTAETDNSENTSVLPNTFFCSSYLFFQEYSTSALMCL